ncbi:MAG: pyruvate carboxylase [Defluviitaleaceae bacterium]|nr:pyruvate carboxylase [Defluviitaleaceae bacterium]MCL2262088.1 pyruvate carboxylase [Defluviitaleaceae bacterium]
MKNRKIKKVLCANRGEIAIRVFRACKDLGLNTVAIYAKEDQYNLFRTKADASYMVGENRTPLGAYLDIDAIIRLAKRKGVDAIHPGYGFLSENANFARACEQNDIIFIGPPSNVLSQMGDKLNAKELAQSVNVPTIPGTEKPLTGVEEAIKKANEYGYPVILKAAAGGGGKGMRKVTNDDELKTVFPLVESEALKSFGSGDIFMEKFLVEPKHIEIQILADKHGNIVHLYERDCSLQRRYQKVIEIAPSVSVPKDVLEKIYADAVKIAKAVNYVSAGTVEFLVDNTGAHYFIEMNPRIQVEHTITEFITGVDIVQAQILVAEGIELSDPLIDIPSQESIRVNGIAIQSRVTTEDPGNHFSPDIGQITVYRSSGGHGVRLDAGNCYTGAEILPYYDSLLVKVCAFGRSFDAAIRRSRRALGEMRIQGVKTNIQFLNNILDHPQFQAGNCHTTFIDDTPSLYELPASRDRDTKILSYISELAVNGDQTAPRTLDPARVPEIPAEFGFTVRDGLKQLLDHKGPDAVKQYCLDSKKLLLSDTTLRDGHQSLLATRVRTKDMVAIAEYMAYAMPDAFALEMWGGATFDVAYRFLNECPWERLRLLREKIPNIPFQMLLRGANAVGYTSYPDNLIRQFIREAAKSGVDVFRVFDSLNWMPNMELSIEEVLNNNKLCEGYICYTGDISDPKRDKYNLNYYVNMAKELEKRGVHILGIKDMSGLLKPYAAEKLVSTLKSEVGLPIHLHTHDTSGNGVATLLKAAEAGVDIVDVAIASMSSLTSQPSMNSVVAALQGHERDTGMDDQKLIPISEYWEQARKFYAPYEEGLTSPTTDIYRYEMPGGQYTNLRAQVESVGLGSSWKEVKENYKNVNDMLGDIVKVTPSSKMVGDFAIFITQNNLTPENIVEKAKNLAFPDSVVSYFSGMMGQPQGGFPKDLQEIVLKGKTAITGRPGEHLEPVDFEKIKAEMESFCPEPTMQDIVAYCLYPKVIKDYYAHRNQNSDLSILDTPVFFGGLRTGEFTEVEIEDGKTLLIRLVLIGEPDEENYRRVVFELNGFRREIIVQDKTIEKTSVKAAASLIADPENPKDIGASLPGMVSKITVSQGSAVKENDVVAVIEAMKMETTIVSKCSGVVGKIFVTEGQPVKAGELLMQIE